MFVVEDFVTKLIGVIGALFALLAVVNYWKKYENEYRGPPI